MLDFHLELISDQAALDVMVDRVVTASALAVDIETINWWNREAERVALVQFAFREGKEPKVAVVDTLANLNLEALRRPLELSSVTKAIHNASYDAVRLSRHFKIRTSPIHDTMLAARRGGERRCSLQAQVERHLGLQLNKSQQRSDWSYRPLTDEQLRYAALDAACTLLLYEHQTTRGLRGDYQLREKFAEDQTAPLWSEIARSAPEFTEPATAPELALSVRAGLSPTARSLLGIVTELPGRYGPDHLAVSVGGERVGLTGWIVDQMLGAEADIDEGSARLEIASLCERGLIRLSPTRRLEATERGAELWRQVKPASQ